MSSSSLTLKPSEPNSIPDDLLLALLESQGHHLLLTGPLHVLLIGALPPISSYNILHSIQQPEKSF